MMKRRGPPSLLEIANRLVEALAKTYLQAFGGAVDLDDLRGFAHLGAVEALRKWNGSGVFDAFCAQRIRWSILRLVRRQILRHLPEPQRDESCALIATERTADAYDQILDGAPVSLPSTGGLMAESLRGYQMELAHADEAVNEVADPGADVERAVQRGELRRAIEALPSPEDTIVARHVYDGETFSEIGEALAMSRSTVHDLYGRGLRRVFEVLGSPSRPPAAHASVPAPAHPSAPL